MVVQSVIFNKYYYTLPQMLEWLEKYNYLNVKRVDITKNYFRFRQSEPKKNRKYRIYKIPNEEIKLVLEY